MQLFQKLWQDERGVVLSAEVVMLGTLGVMGAVVGLNAASTAVDEELKEFAGAIRSLDQSYGYMGHQSCRAWTAGSYYRQQDVQQSLTDLCGNADADVRAIQRHVDTQRVIHLPPAPQPMDDTDGLTPVTPNQIPVPQLNVDEPKVDEPKAQEPASRRKRKMIKKGDRDED
jgi:hypothetical protein